MTRLRSILRVSAFALSLAYALSLAGPVLAATILVPQGTVVQLAFDDPLTSKKAYDGEIVHFHVTEPVIVDGKTIIAPGTHVIGTVTKHNKANVYGVNAKIQLQLSPVRSVTGKMIPLGFASKGKLVSGHAAGAAAATIGGAVLLGPIGLVGGLFVHGKSVNVHPGDKITSTVDQDVRLHM